MTVPAAGVAAAPDLEVYVPAGAGDPRVEAARWLETACAGRAAPPVLVVVGLGSAHLLDVLGDVAPQTRVLAVEPDPRAADVARARGPWQAWRASGRLVHLVAPGYTGADQAWRVFPPGSDECALLVHPRLRTDHPSARQAALTARRVVAGVQANVKARKRFAPAYLTSVLRNIPSIARGRDVRALEGVFAGRPAVVAAAGPSLDASLDALRETRDRAVLIAVDTALRPLLTAGVEPHVAVGLDPGDANARHFRELAGGASTWLVAEAALQRATIAPFLDRTFWFRASNHQPWPWLREQGIDVGQFDVWGSVLTAAFQVAVLAGCDPVVFVGADLAFTGGQPYARGTTYEFDWAYQVAGGTPLSQIWAAHVATAPPEATPDVRGEETTSTPALISVRDWLVARASRLGAECGRRVINATPGGILFGQGVEQDSLDEVLGDRIAVPSLVAVTGAPRRLKPTALASRLRTIARTMGGASPAQPVRAWMEFCGGGFQARETMVALDEAARGLETKGRPPGAADAWIPWGHLPATTLTRLPELAERLRAALACETAPAPTGADPAECLSRALRLLGPILEQVSCLQRLDAVNVVGLGNQGSLARQYYWPVHLQWAVQAFEALLGQSVSSVLPASQPSFFCGPLVERDTSLSFVPAGNRGVPQVVEAGLLLLLEWVRCALALGGGAPGAVQARDRLLSLVHLVRTHASADGGRSRLEISAGPPGASPEVLGLDLPVRVAALSRILTGAVGVESAGAVELACVETDAFRASVVLRVAEGTVAGPAARAFGFRRLSDEGAGLMALQYAAGDRAIAVVNHAGESLAIDASGAIATHHAWPRPLVGELPWGETGAVAWGNGLAGWPEVEAAYVMYRRSAAGEVTIEELPFRPAIGAWWQGRVYFGCFPARAETFVGVASWAPGEAARDELPGLTIVGLQPGETGLRLEPCVYELDGGYRRTRASSGWEWRPGAQPATRALGTHGSASSTSAAHGWTATAHPEADLIVLESDDGRSVSLHCHHPMRVAWAGRSLVVSTAYREVLLFECLADMLGLTPPSSVSGLRSPVSSPESIAAPGQDGGPWRLRESGELKRPEAEQQDRRLETGDRRPTGDEAA